MIAPLRRVHTTVYRTRVFTHDRGGFNALRNANVLIYFPHGFGDWVQFAYVLALLDRSNRYWITRFGDDNVGVLEGNEYVEPFYLGTNDTQNGDGASFGNRHFGMSYDEIDGGERELLLPDSLHEFCTETCIDAVLWTSFPEVGGSLAFPYQSKARNVIRYLISRERLGEADLSRPLGSSVSFEVAPWVRQWVESRVKNFLGSRGRKLCLIGRNGFTSVGKNWGHQWREDLPAGRRREGEECRDFMRLMLRKDNRWMFLVMEERLFEGDDTVRSPELHAYSYAEIFGSAEASSIPFSLVMKVLAEIADLCVGVPSGPYHLAMAKPELPTVGLWIEHVPSWFDEPKDASIHVISRNVRDRAVDRKPGSFFSKGQLKFRTMYVETRVIAGEQAVAAAEQLL